MINFWGGRKAKSYLQKSSSPRCRVLQEENSSLAEVILKAYYESIYYHSRPGEKAEKQGIESDICAVFAVLPALAPLLPREIIHRKKKGFGSPVGLWFREGLLLFMEIDEKAMSSDYAKRLYREHMENKSDNRLFLWSWWLLEKMYEKTGAQ